MSRPHLKRCAINRRLLAIMRVQLKIDAQTSAQPLREK
jgi:hypothetical protein